MKKITLLLLLVAFAISSFAQEADSVNVTFNVDFKPFIESPYDTVPFDADNDSVYVSGGFAGWSEPGTDDEYLMTDADDDSVYTLTVKLKMDSTYYYKFFYVPAGDGSSWEYGDFAGFDNRVLELGSSDTTLNKAFSHFPYELMVKDSEQDTGIAGASVMFEDETLTTDSEGKIQRLLLHDSTFHYTIKADNGFIDKEAELNFGHFPTKDTMMMEPLYVTLNVNMKTFADTSSDFVYGEDSVYVSGVGGDWSEPGTNMDYLMKDTDGDSIFTTKVQVDSGATEYKYSYVPAGEGSSWDYGEWDGGDNRTLDVPNKSISVNNMWGVNETTYNASFMVTDTSGATIEDAKVMLGDYSAMTNSTGEATLGVVDSTYDFTVSKRGYTDSSKTVTISADTSISVELTPLTQSVTFSVTDMDSVVIEGATVVLNEEDTLTTDGQGEASTTLSSGEYMWEVMAEDYVTETGVTEILADTTLSFKLALQTYTATFVVKDEDTTAFQGATVEVAGETLTTDASGEASISLPIGSHDYTVTAVDYEDATGTVTINDSDVTEELIMSLKLFTVTFNVTDEQGSTLEGVSISVGDATETTLADGIVQLELPNGEHNYTATADGYEDESGSFTVDGDDMSIDVIMTATSTSIDNPLAKQLKVYPNPSDGNITLEGANIKGAQISILNSIGKRVKQIKLDNNTNYLHLDELKSGIYFIKIEDNNNEAVRKVLIK